MHVTKSGDGSTVEDSRVTAQKQDGLYAVEYHPIGGCPNPEKLIEIYDAIKDMDQVELRVAPDETVYIINCTGNEAKKILDVTNDGAASLLRHLLPASALPSVRWASEILRSCWQLLWMQPENGTSRREPCHAFTFPDVRHPAVLIRSDASDSAAA